MKPGIDPKVDVAFKKLFGSEENVLLAVDLVNAVTLPPAGRLTTGLSFLDPHSLLQSPEDKLTIADIKARDQSGRQYQLEMQWRAPRHFVKRVLFYGAKFHAGQLQSGEHYLTLCKTTCICFLNQSLFAKADDHLLVFRPRDEKHGLVLTDDLEFHLIELPKFTKSPEQLESALDRWCYFLRHGAELDAEKLPPTLDVPIIRQALEVLNVWTQEEHEREAYERKLKAQRDYASDMVDAREEGVLAGKVQLAQEMLNQPQTPVTTLTALPLEDLTALLTQLRNQLLSKKNGTGG